MTQVIYQSDNNQLLISIEPENADLIQYKMRHGRWSYPLSLKRPRCYRINGLLLVTERTPLSDLPDISMEKQAILKLLIRGKTLRQISGEVHLSYSGVRYHIRKLKEAFGVTTIAELIAKNDSK